MTIFITSMTINTFMTVFMTSITINAFMTIFMTSLTIKAFKKVLCWLMKEKINVGLDFFLEQSTTRKSLYSVVSYFALMK